MDSANQGSAEPKPSSDVATGGRVIHLRTLSSKAPVSRDAAFALWRKGLVAGLFNIPSEAVFDACTDFCIEDEIAENSQDVVKIIEQQSTRIDTLYASLRNTLRNSIAARTEVEVLSERSRDLAGQIVLLDEQREDDRKKLASSAKSLKDMKRESDAKFKSLETKFTALTEALAKSEKENIALKADHKRMEMSTQANAEQNGSLQSSNTKLEQSVVQLTSRISQLDIALKASSTSQDQLTSLTSRNAGLEAENRRLTEHIASSLATEADLRSQIQSLSDAFESLQEQHNQLSGTASRLQADNFELRNADSGYDQNDVLNQRLLSHYRYLVQLTEDQDSEEGGSDSEAWK